MASSGGIVMMLEDDIVPEDELIRSRQEEENFVFDDEFADSSTDDELDTAAELSPCAGSVDEFVLQAMNADVKTAREMAALR